MNTFKVAISVGYTVFRHEVKAGNILDAIKAAKDKHSKLQGIGEGEVLSAVMWSK